MKNELTQKFLHEYLDYNSETGIFTWKKNIANVKAGSSPNYGLKIGYRMVRISGKKYLAHRLAWFHVHGKWPRNHIDHVNGDRSDNRIINLREATRSQNMGNFVRTKHTPRSGFKGVTADGNLWVARIYHNKKQHRLGWFKTPQEAHEAYSKAARLIFGEFARAV